MEGTRHRIKDDRNPMRGVPGLVVRIVMKADSVIRARCFGSLHSGGRPQMRVSARRTETTEDGDVDIMYGCIV